MATNNDGRILPRNVSSMFAKSHLAPTQSVYYLNGEASLSVILAIEAVGLEKVLSGFESLASHERGYVLSMLNSFTKLDRDYFSGMESGWSGMALRKGASKNEKLGHTDGRAAWSTVDSGS